jgi:hypothetical protein
MPGSRALRPLPSQNKHSPPWADFKSSEHFVGPHEDSVVGLPSPHTMHDDVEWVRQTALDDALEPR